MSQQLSVESEMKFSYEINISNNWKEFIILDKEYSFKDGIEEPILNKKLSDLDNNIYGKYFKGCIGYNTSGWWEYINVNKNKLRYKNK